MENGRRNIEQENRRLRRLQLMVDLVSMQLQTERQLTLTEGINIIRGVKNYALSLFPDKERQFNLIYQSRLVRILVERNLFNKN
ncbi:MAG: hypothetical protein Kow0037_09490 [Calditrichia bacterium]